MSYPYVKSSACLICALLLAACGPEAGPEPTALPPSSLPWAIATANPLATQAGADILADGGSVVDAAITVQSVLGLVEPQSSGFGGGAFMLYYNASTKELIAYDGREIAPASATPDMFLNEDGSKMGFYDAVTSGRSVGVPGVVAMLEEAHEAHGVKAWEDLFETAEDLATAGFPLSPRLHKLLGRFTKFTENEAARQLYYDDSGKPFEVGTKVQNPDYAQTLRRMAEGGADAFYGGTIADQIIEAVNAKAGDGTMTKEDLEDYEPVLRQAVCAPVFEVRICSMGPPSSGGVTLLQILTMTSTHLEGKAPSSSGWHGYIEASRLAYADRDLYLGDPDNMGGGNVQAEDIIGGLLSPEYLQARAGLIGATAAEDVTAGEPLATPLKEGRARDTSPDLPGTSHFSIRDDQGNIVSMTTTVEFVFGSHLMAGGMVLNNQLTDFSFLPEQDGRPAVNAAAPGKRPRSSMSPVIVFDQEGTPILAMGSPGGPAIIGYVAKTLLAHLAWGMPLQEAITLPNLVTAHGKVMIEEGADPHLISDLEDFGHNLTQRDLTSGLYGFALSETGIESGVDPRREGSFLKGP